VVLALAAASSTLVAAFAFTSAVSFLAFFVISFAFVSAFVFMPAAALFASDAALLTLFVTVRLVAAVFRF
jgi:hypothetical protein